MHLTGITPALSASCAGAVDAAIAGARQRPVHGQLRRQLPPGAVARCRLARRGRCAALAQRCDIVFVGLDEARALWGTPTAEQVRDLIDRPRVLVVKDSDRSATAFDGGRARRGPRAAVEVVEPVGAGDAFAGGWWHARLTRRDRRGRAARPATGCAVGSRWPRRPTTRAGDGAGG